MKDREEAVEYFQSKRGKEMAREIAKKAKMQAAMGNSDKPLMSTAEKNKIKNAISNATSLDEVKRLGKLLQSGNFPTEEHQQNGNRNL